MKKQISLLIFACCTLISTSQDIRKQLEDLDSAFARDDYPTAQRLVEKITPTATNTIKDDSIYIEFLNKAGSLYYRLNQYPQAIEYFLETSKKASARWGENEYHYALAIFNLAACYKEEGRYVEAEPLYLKSLPVLSVAFGQSSLEYTRCFYTLASLYIEMKKYEEAESMCAAAVNFYKVILGPESDDYLGALGSMAVIYQGQAKYDKAEEIFLSLKNYFTAKPVSPKRNETLQVLENNLGELYRHIGDYVRAESSLEEAVKLAENNPITEASALNNLALVQKNIGKYSEAERSYKRSISLYQSLDKTNHPDYTNPVNNLGELYRTMGRWQEAVYAFEEVIVLRQKLLGADHPNYANAVNNLALIQFTLGMLDDAERNLLICKEIYKKALGEKDRFYANALNNLASVYKAQGKYNAAEEYYKECLRIYKETHGETSDKYGIYLGGLAGTYRQLKRYDEAISLTLRSLEILRNKLGEYHYDHVETEYQLAETYREAGKYTEAEKHYHNSMKGYLQLIKRYFPYLSEKEKTSFYYAVANAFETFNSFVIQMKSAFPKKDISALVTRMYDNQLAIKSLLLRESEKMRDAVANSNDHSLKKDFADWIQLRESIVQQFRSSEEDRTAKGMDLVEMETRANALEQKMTIALKLVADQPARGIVWQDIKKGLNTGEKMVEIIRTDYYLNGRWTDTVYYSALIIDKETSSPQFLLLRNGKELESSGISGYRRGIRSKINDENSYELFWKPLQASLANAKRIFISPDGVYLQLNLQTLRNPASKKYLVEEANIKLVTNASDILVVHRLNSSHNVDIFSFPDYDLENKSSDTSTFRLAGFPHLGDLPGTRIEADSIRTIMHTLQWKVQDITQAAATEDAIKKIARPQVLHIATHGFFLKDINESLEQVMGLQSDIARENPLLRSGVILAGALSIARDSVNFSKEDGILTAYEAAGLDLNTTDLVVLSACETGLGEILNGQGVYGLQRSFLVAGAKTVIMSLWTIDDKATQELMVNFYREWLKDPTPANKQLAFRSAQLKLKEKWPEPFYWGAFVMVGE